MTLDTRHNLLSVLLIGAIAVLVLVGAISFALLGRTDVESIQSDTRSAGSIDAPVAESPSLADLSEYAQIVERPVFFADRSLPVMEVAGPADEVVATEPEAETEIPALGASVAGIIITPEVKLAMVTDSDSNETMVLREGMAMGGDKSAWRVASIRPRGVQFQTDAGRTEDLELEVETAALKPGARPRPAEEDVAPPGQERAEQTAQAPQDEESQQEAARARAEEIRRRVAERRAQLRAEAERRAREQDGGGP